jgi:hypothetical protein
MDPADDAVTPNAGGSLSSALNAFMSAGGRSATSAAKMLSGSYTQADATADVDWWSSNAVEWTRELFACWAELARLFVPPRAEQPSSTIDAKVHASVTDRPLTLATTGFRAIGHGTLYFIPSSDVMFTPSQVPAGSDTFMVKVSCTSLPPQGRDITIIYEGEITSTETSALVCDTIRFVNPASQ